MWAGAAAYMLGVVALGFGWALGFWIGAFASAGCGVAQAAMRDRAVELAARNVQQ